MLKLPNFLALRAFEAAARLCRSRKAADELHVSHTVISRHVRALESSTGVELDETPVGTRYWNAALTLEAATMGHGIALAPDLIVRDALAGGQLVPVVSTAIEIFPYIFVTRRNRERDAIVLRFRKWIQKNLAESDQADAKP